MFTMADREEEEVNREDGEDAIGLACALDEFVHKELVLKHIRELGAIYQNPSMVELDYEQFMKVLDLYQEKPSLITPSMKEIVEEALRHVNITQKGSAIPDQDILPPGFIPLKHLSLKYLKHVFKVYRPKKACKFMPHEITNLVPVLELLESVTVEDPDFQDSASVLIYWLSVLVMNPFGLKLLDGYQNQGGTSVTQRIVDICMRCIVLNNNAGKATPVLIAKLLTRPDTLKREGQCDPCDLKPHVCDLESFIEWGCQNMSASQKFSVRAGAFGALAGIFKQGNRADVCSYGTKVLDALMASGFQEGDTYLRKMGIKLLQRVGMIFLKPKIAHWRYARGNRSLLANLKPKSQLENATGGGSSDQPITPQEEIEDSYEDLAEFSNQIESILDILLKGLDDKDFVVRMTAAKGVARIVNRIPKAYAKEIIDAVLSLMGPISCSGAWAGACLALAELGKKGLLLPSRLPEIVDVLQRALMYEEVGGGYSGGRQVRDCACFVAFSFARCFDKEILAPYIKTLATTLILVALFDREVTCRRAGAAAFQENVGRQGNLPHGQRVSEMADYITVASRVRAYTEVSVKVADIEEYRRPILNHLINVKYCHRDPVIRELTAEAVRKLTHLDRMYMATTVMDKLTKDANSANVEIVSGAIMCTTAIILACKIQRNLECLELRRVDELGDVLVTVIKNLPNFSVQDNILLREALNYHIHRCRFPEEEPSVPKYQPDFLHYLHECVFFNHKKVQATAALALDSLIQTHFRSPYLELHMGDLVGPLVELLISPSETTRLGAALAFEAILPRVHPVFPDIALKNLIQCARRDQEHAIEWVESRKTAISALGNLMKKGYPRRTEAIGTAHHVATAIRTAILAGLNDYTSDRRGDVGSVVREKSITAAISLLTADQLLFIHKISSFEEKEFVGLLAAIARQCVEKIDNLRIFACNSFLEMLHGTPLTKFSRWGLLVEHFSTEPYPVRNWKITTVTFEKFAPLMIDSATRKEVLTGFITTGGSLGGSNQVEALEAVCSLIEKNPCEQNPEIVPPIMDCIIEIFKDNLQVDRVSVPLMKFVKLLLERDLFQTFTLELVERFGLGMINCIKMEINKTTNVEKILIAVDVLLGLFEGGEKLIDASLRRLVIILCHQYPRVRRLTADKMVAELPLHEEKIENFRAVINILQEVHWEDPPLVVKPKRNEICELLKIPSPVQASTSKSETAASSV